MKNLATCIYCGSQSLTEVDGYSALKRITSDCKPWPAGGRFAICNDCHYPQNIVDDQWYADIKAIYQNYQVYFQSGGKEQSIYDANGNPMLRSDHLVRRLLETSPIQSTGHLLDIGCANGNFVRAFGQAAPQWKMSGVEWDEKYLSEVMEVPGFEKLYSDGMASVPDGFDLISLIHCFEHIPDPGPMLRSIHEKLLPGGTLFIDVPDCSVNPFVLVVADHSSHFSLTSLTRLIEQAGFEIVCATANWLAKEISIVARKGQKADCPLSLETSYAERLKHHIHWMQAVSSQAKALASSQPIGIFGTSIAATWLWAELDGNVSFFVDEDPNRKNCHHCNIPILSPSDTPKDIPVFLALPPVVCNSVQKRLGDTLPLLVRPPELEIPIP